MRDDTVIPGLTPLRGLAAIHVLMLHYTTQLLPTALAGDPIFVRNGRLAVELFFILSGIVLTQVYAARFRDGIDLEGWLDFMANRLARVWPLAATMTLAALLLAWATSFAVAGWPDPLKLFPLSGRDSWLGALATITLTSGFFEHIRWNYPQWSITAELMAYLSVPFVINAVFTLDRRWLWPVVAIGFLPHLMLDLAAILFSRSPEAVVTLTAFNATWNIEGPAGGILRIVDGPAIAARSLGMVTTGVAICRLWRLGALRWLASPWAFLASGTLLLVLLGNTLPDCLTLAAMLLVIGCAMVATGPAAALLNAAPLVWLGNVSYSVYLLHAPLQIGVRNLASVAGIKLYELDPGHARLLLAALSLLVLGLAHFSWRRIELPARDALRCRWRRRNLPWAPTSSQPMLNGDGACIDARV